MNAAGMGAAGLMDAASKARARPSGWENAGPHVRAKSVMVANARIETPRCLDVGEGRLDSRRIHSGTAI